MTPERFRAITSRYAQLRLAVIGDFCLDRYLEIDPARSETSIETELPVHNVVRIRSQPGAAGTILNNLVALGIGHLHVVGFCGDDGEGYELQRALRAQPGVCLDRFFRASDRRTFTYTKPLLVEASKPPVELNRLDLKNWTPTPPDLCGLLERAARELAPTVNALILMDQVDVADTGVVNRRLLGEIANIARDHPHLLILADSRRGLGDFPGVTFKMNIAELSRMLGRQVAQSVSEVRRQAVALAGVKGRPVFVTMAEQGMVGATPEGASHHASALPLRGEIDIVGAGDSVTANLAAALAAGAGMEEALELAMHAASIVIHQLGTTGTASVSQLGELLKVT